MDLHEENDSAVQSTPRLVIDESQLSTQTDVSQKSSDQSQDSSVPRNTDLETCVTPVQLSNDEAGHEGQVSADKPAQESSVESTDNSESRTSASDRTKVAEVVLSPRTKRKMSMEEIKQWFEELGNMRCPHCSFMTSEQQLYEAHCTTCTTRVRPGRPSGLPTSQTPADKPVSSSDTDRPGSQLISQGNNAKPDLNKPAVSTSSMPDVKKVLKFSYSKDSKEFTCDGCNLKWTEKNQFEEHVVCHTIDLPYICLTCKKNYASRQHLEIHSKKEHPKGDARCGLRGIKLARKVVDTVLTTGNVVLPRAPQNTGPSPVKLSPSPSKSETVGSASANSAKQLVESEQMPVSTASSSSPLETSIPSSTATKPESVTTAVITTSGISSTSVTVSSASNVSLISVSSSSSAMVTTSTQSVVTSADVSSAAVLQSDKLSTVQPDSSELPVAITSTDTCSKDEIKATDMTGENQNADKTKSVVSLSTDTDDSTAQKTSTLTSLKVDNYQRHNLVVSPQPYSTVHHKPSATVASTSSANLPLTTADVSEISSKAATTATNVSLTIEETQAVKEKLGSTFPVRHQTSQQQDPTLVSTRIQQIVSPTATQKSSRHYVVKSISEVKPPPNTNSGDPLPGLLLGSQQLVASSGMPPILLLPIPTPRNTGPGLFLVSTQSITQLPATPQYSSSVIGMPKLPGPVHLSTASQISAPQMPLLSLSTNNSQVAKRPPLYMNSTKINQPTPRLAAHTIVNRSQFPISIQYPVAMTQGQVVLPASILTDTASSTSIPPGPPPRNKHFLPTLATQNKLQQEPCTVVVGNATEAGNSKMQSKRFVFRLKPNQGYVCEECKKFTKDILVFKKHVWEHFHSQPFSCKYCSPLAIASRDVFSCKLVNKIVENLVNRSQSEVDILGTMNVNIPSGDAVIDITGDEKQPAEAGEKAVQQKVTEVIVIDDNEEEESGQSSGMQIKISDTYSLALQQDLQDMNKDSSSNDGTHDKTTTEVEEQAANNKGKLERTKSTEEQGELKSTSERDKEVIEIPDDDAEKRTGNKAIKEKQIDTGTGKNEPDKSISTKTPTDYSSTEKPKENSLTPKDTESNERKGIEDSSTKDAVEHDEEKVTSFISQVLECGEFDPTKDDSQDQEPMDVDEGEPSAAEEIIGSKARKLASVKVDETNKVGLQELDNTAITKHAHEAFYLCGFEDCNFVCLSSQNYKDHLKCSKHAKEYCYVCGHCGQKDYTEDGHVRHLFSHGNVKRFCLFNCPVRLCKYKTNLIRMYAEHVKAHQGEELTIICTYCHKTFQTVENLIDHLQQNLLKFVGCPYCSYRFVNRSLVMRHMRLCHPDRARMVSVSSQIVCNEREINFYVYPKVKQLKTTSFAQSVEPEGENLDISAILEEVQKSQSPEHPSYENDSEDENGNNENLEDADSNLNMKSKTSNKSDGDKSGRLKIIDTVGPKSLRCEKCSYLTYSPHMFKQHLAVHDMEPERHMRYLCNLCPKGQKDYTKFKVHVANHIGIHEIKLYSCTMCSFNSNQKSHIMDHCEDGHTPKSLYTLKTEMVKSQESSCKYCDFKARNSEHVFQHERLVHKVKPVQSVEPMIKPKGSGATETVQAQNTSNQSGHGEMNNQRRSIETDETASTSESEQSKKRRKYHCELCKEFFKHKQNLKDHMTNEHRDVEDKQFVFFKCKYCSYTSTMKEIITNHIRKKHAGEEIRILRKIEAVDLERSTALSTTATVTTATPEVDTSLNDDDELPDIASPDNRHISDSSQKAEDPKPKEEVIVPDGNTFKDPFYCPKCPFSSNLRIHTMRHLKTHSELKPTRPTSTPDKKSGKTARKSTAIKIKFSMSPGSSNNKFKASLLSPSPDVKMQNPFKQVKEAVNSMNTSQMSSFSAPTSPSNDFYVLGEHNLHAVLSACFVPVDKELRFQCRICKQKIAKKFVLHRHILDHLKVVFFKCNYCEEGSIERTLLMSHIQKEHSSMPVKFTEVSKAELEHTMKERIFQQDFNDTVDIFASSNSATTVSAESHGLKIRPVHESGEILSDSESEASSLSLILDKSDQMKHAQVEKLKATKSVVVEKQKSTKLSPASSKSNVNKLKCPRCPYVAPRAGIIEQHIVYHGDPEKRYMCSVCSYRGDRFNVIKHIYRVYHASQSKIVEDTSMFTVKTTNSAGQQIKSPQVVDVVSDGNSSSEESPEVEPKEEIELSSTKQVVATKDGNNIPQDSLSSMASGAFEMKMIFKCKLCGVKKNSKRVLYNHFNSSKCKSPYYGCSICKFQTSTKVGIYKHGQIRHKGKKVVVNTLPLAAKIQAVKIPIKQDNQVEKIMKKRLDMEMSSDEESESEVGDDIEESEEEAKSVTVNAGLKCMLCKKFTCESAMRLQNHINTIHQGVHIHCQVCPYTTPLIKHMLNHCTNLHRQEQPLYADKPRNSPKKPTPIPKSPSSSQTPHKTSRSSSSDRSSVTSAEEKNFQFALKCPKCDFLTLRRDNLHKHLFVHYKYKPYMCVLCKTFHTQLKSLKLHFFRRHSGKEVKYKHVMNASIIKKIELDMAKAAKNCKEKKMAAGLGRPTFLDKLDLVEEGIRKQNSKLFYCEVCGFKRTTLLSIKQHIELVHRKPSKKRLREVDSEDEDPLPSKVQKTGTNAEKHDKRPESKGYQSLGGVKMYHVSYNDDGEKIFGCERCMFDSNRKTDAVQHYLDKHKGHAQKLEFSCVICYLKFSNLANAYRHVRNVHPGKELQVKNMISGRVMRLYESGYQSKPVPRPQSPARSMCSESSDASFTDIKEFLSNSPVQPEKMRKKKVSGEYVYSCHLCSMETVSLFFYRLHLATHGECQYTREMTAEESKCFCAYCSFIAPSEFEHKLHLAKHPTERRFQCVYCLYTSFEKHSIMQHSKVQHSDRRALCMDRDSNEVTAKQVYLVDLNPDLKLNQVRLNQARRKRYKRIRIESDSDSEEEKELSNLDEQILNNSSSGYVESILENVGSQGDNPNHNIDAEMYSSHGCGPPTLERETVFSGEALIATPLSEESMDYIEGSETNPDTLFREDGTDFSGHRSVEHMTSVANNTSEQRDRCNTQSFDVTDDFSESPKLSNETLESDEVNLEYRKSSGNTITESQALEQVQNHLAVSSQGFDYQSESEQIDELNNETSANNSTQGKLEQKPAAENELERSEKVTLEKNDSALSEKDDSSSGTLNDTEVDSKITKSAENLDSSALEESAVSIEQSQKTTKEDQVLVKRKDSELEGKRKAVSVDNEAVSGAETNAKANVQCDTTAGGKVEHLEYTGEPQGNSIEKLSDTHEGPSKNRDKTDDKVEQLGPYPVNKTVHSGERDSELGKTTSHSKEPCLPSSKDVTERNENKSAERVGIFNQFETNIGKDIDENTGAKPGGGVNEDEEIHGRGNIFEKFGDERAFADDDESKEIKETHSGGDNIFDKFNVDGSEVGADNILAVETRKVDDERTASSENIFEKFSSAEMSGEEDFYVVDEVTEGDASCAEEDNIFDKMKDIGVTDGATETERGNIDTSITKCVSRQQQACSNSLLGKKKCTAIRMAGEETGKLGVGKDEKGLRSTSHIENLDGSKTVAENKAHKPVKILNQSVEVKTGTADNVVYRDVDGGGAKRKVEDMELDELIDTIDNDLTEYKNSQEQMDTG